MFSIGTHYLSMATLDFTAARTHVESMLGNRFTNADLLREALHAGEPVIISSALVTEQNKRLAMIGDSALDLALAITDYRAGLSRGMSLLPQIFMMRLTVI